MQTVLVVGVDSQIGSALAVHLRCQGYRVIGTTRRKARVDANTVFLDLREKEVQHSLPEVDAAVVCAGITRTANCEEAPDECRLINVENTIAVIDKCAIDGAFVLFLSSSAVFDGTKAFYTVSDSPNPANNYGKFKLAVERHILEGGRKDTAVLRLTKIVTRDAPFIKSWEQAATEAHDILAYTNKRLSPLSVSEAVDSVTLLICRREGGLYHLGGAEDISYFDYAKRYFANDSRALDRIKGQLDSSIETGSVRHESLATHLPTKEPQYGELLETKRVTMGLMSGHAYINDPKRLSFTLARYKFVSKMFAGFERVLEIGCADAFGTPIVMKEVGKLVASDFDVGFINDVRRTHPFSGLIEFAFQDLVKAAIVDKFDGIFALDVLEHVEPKDEGAFLRNVSASLREDGVCIIGMPSLESQSYASEISRRGHVNCKSGSDLKGVLLRYFKRVFVFSMNDEVVHTGFAPMAHYLIAMGVGIKE